MSSHHAHEEIMKKLHELEEKIDYLTDILEGHVEYDEDGDFEEDEEGHEHKGCGCC